MILKKLFSLKKDKNLLKSPITGYPVIVDRIHKEFEEVSDKLLKEALNILNGIKEDTDKEDKIKRLKNLGFNNVNEVKEVEKKLKFKKEQESLVNTINYFKVKYPFYKFITEDQVEQICKKYNLIFGAINRYTGFVPDKNLKEIENFKIKDEDCVYVYSSKPSYFHLEEYYVNKSEYEHWSIKIEGKYVFEEGNSIEPDSWYRKRYSLGGKVSMQIAAPLKDMELGNNEEVKNFKIVKKEIPDPVILQPVIYKDFTGKNKIGYLIVTKWGDEASDPIVQNPIEN